MRLCCLRNYTYITFFYPPHNFQNHFKPTQHISDLMPLPKYGLSPGQVVILTKTMICLNPKSNIWLNYTTIETSSFCSFGSHTILCFRVITSRDTGMMCVMNRRKIFWHLLKWLLLPFLMQVQSCFQLLTPLVNMTSCLTSHTLPTVILGNNQTLVTFNFLVH